MKKHIVTFSLLLIAIVFYAMGAAGPATVFLVMGALAELSFWYRIYDWLKSRSAGQDGA